MNAELIAPCGMNCGVCGAFLALQYDVRRLGLRTPYCTGCRPRGKTCSYIKKQCDALLAGRIEYCYQCRVFPCHNLSHLDERYARNYRMSMVANLLYLKTHGVTALLARERERWACPRCGEVISCHNGVCYSCSAEVLITRKKVFSWTDAEGQA